MVLNLLLPKQSAIPCVEVIHSLNSFEPASTEAICYPFASLKYDSISVLNLLLPKQSAIDFLFPSSCIIAF